MICFVICNVVLGNFLMRWCAFGLVLSSVGMYQICPASGVVISDLGLIRWRWGPFLPIADIWVGMGWASCARGQPRKVPEIMTLRQIEDSHADMSPLPDSFPTGACLKIWVWGPRLFHIRPTLSSVVVAPARHWTSTRRRVNGQQPQIPNSQLCHLVSQSVSQSVTLSVSTDSNPNSTLVCHPSCFPSFLLSLPIHPSHPSIHPSIRPSVCCP